MPAPTRVAPASAPLALLAAGVVTATVTAASYLVTADYAATAVGLLFLAATWWLLLRGDDDELLRHHGLSFGGVLERRPVNVGRALRDFGRASAWALAVAAVVLPPFWLGYWFWHGRPVSFAAAPLTAVGAEILGQVLVIALPEEAFYRGFLQTRLDDAWGARWSLLGARVGPAILVTSALFALGHLVTDAHPSRLAVFFPSLLFGWLRARTGSVGASTVLHALCNLFASYLASSYGLAS